MKHRAFALALSVLAAVVWVVGAPSQAYAADPSGIWEKDDGSAKMEVKKCGRGICSKIVWLKDPIDSRGKPLHDARNEDPSMRDRPIIGLPLFGSMMPTETNVWVGNVYNPEEGHIYSDVKVTLVSRQQIVLRGCKAWLLCGEKSWTRSQLPPSAAPAEPIEVNAPAEPGEAAPGATPQPKTPIVEAAPEPVAREPEATREPKLSARMPSAGAGMPAPAIEADAAATSVAPKMMKPTQAPVPHQTYIGPGLVTTTASPETLPLSGENVSSMMVMTRPAPVAATKESPVTEAAADPAGQDQDPLEPGRIPRPNKVQAAADMPAPALPHVVKPKPKPKAQEPQEQLPWLQHP